VQYRVTSYNFPPLRESPENSKIVALIVVVSGYDSAMGVLYSIRPLTPSRKETACHGQ
jgi:hypothetical protein